MFVCVDRTCSAVDLVFLVADSRSQSDFYWSYANPFVMFAIGHVAVSESQYKVAIVTFNRRAMLDVQLRAASVAEIYSQFPNTTGGRGNNLRQALFTARTQAFSIDNGMRPPAYKTVIVLWDGQTPESEFGSLVDEAPRLRTMLGADVYVIVSARHQAASRSLVEAIASQPYDTHTSLDSSRRVDDAVADVLVNIQLSCQRSLRMNSPAGSPSAPAQPGPIVLPITTTLSPLTSQPRPVAPPATTILSPVTSQPRPIAPPTTTASFAGARPQPLQIASSTVFRQLTSRNAPTMPPSPGPPLLRSTPMPTRTRRPLTTPRMPSLRSTPSVRAALVNRLAPAENTTATGGKSLF